MTFETMILIFTIWMVGGCILYLSTMQVLPHVNNKPVINTKRHQILIIISGPLIWMALIIDPVYEIIVKYIFSRYIKWLQRN